MSKILYSLEEIKIYNGVNQAKIWIIIGESIYDVTDYMNKVTRSGNIMSQCDDSGS